MSLTRRFLLAAAALAAPGVAQAQKKLEIPAKWYTVRVEENAFTVEMPGVPDHRVINDVSVRGTPFALHSYSLESGGFSYVAQTALYPVDVDTTQPNRVLQASLDARAKNLSGGKWSSVNWRVVDEGATVDSVGALPTGPMLRQLSLMKERRFVSLAFMGPSVTGPEADRFFKSLKLK
jgi:hypothetical protein